MPRQLARRLQAVIDKVGVKIDDIPESVDDPAGYVFFTAPDPEKALNDVEIRLTQGGESGAWRFTAATLVALPTFEKVVAEKKQAQPPEPEIDLPSARRSPRATMKTFLDAMNAKPKDIERLIAAAEERFGPVDTLVNNAGTNPYYGPIAESEDWAWDRTMDVNLRGPYLLSRELGAKMMAGDGGSIVNISSVAGLEAGPGQGIYSVSKAGLIMLTKVMAREMGAAGVRVNCICPGVIRTHLSRALWEDEETAEVYLSRKALGRFGEADELVGAAIYFASGASSFTTGAVLQVDGGMVI